MYTRQQFMNNEINYAFYYGQFLTKSILETIALRIGRDRIKASKDIYFNDIPLKEFDRLHLFIVSQVSNKLREVNGSISLSDTVCIAKAACTRIKGE